MELHMQSLTLSRRSGAIDHNPSKFGRAMTFAVPLAVAALEHGKWTVQAAGKGGLCSAAACFEPLD